MSGANVRSGIRKKASLKMGRKTIRLDVGQEQELFTVHEELICMSPFFRNILQPRRKTIEGDCPICHDGLDATVKELAYCSTSCGGNFHRSCIDDWTAQRANVRCPLCRQTWAANTDASSEIHRLPALDADAFEIFFEWLYKDKVPFDEEDNTTIHKLIQAYALGVSIENDQLREDVLWAILDYCVKRGKHPSAKQIELAYNNTTDSCRLRSFLVGLYANLLTKRYENVSRNWDKYPTAFLRDLTVALAANRGKKVVPWELDALEAVLFPQNIAGDSDDGGESESEVEQGDAADARAARRQEIRHPASGSRHRG